MGFSYRPYDLAMNIVATFVQCWPDGKVLNYFKKNLKVGTGFMLGDN